LLADSLPRLLVGWEGKHPILQPSPSTPSAFQFSVLLVPRGAQLSQCLKFQLPAIALNSFSFEGVSEDFWLFVYHTVTDLSELSVLDKSKNDILKENVVLNLQTQVLRHIKLLV